LIRKHDDDDEDDEDKLKDDNDDDDCNDVDNVLESKLVRASSI